jgi:hypothetical protein
MRSGSQRQNLIAEKDAAIERATIDTKKDFEAIKPEEQKKSDAAQDESAESYDIFGAVEYAFYDSSVIRLQDIHYDETTRPMGDVAAALRRAGAFTLMKSKVKCMNLPSEWNPS